MFKKLYLWEIRKMISLKGIIVLAAIAVLALLLINAMFNITMEFTSEMYENEAQLPEGEENGKVLENPEGEENDSGAEEQPPAPEIPFFGSYNPVYGSLNEDGEIELSHLEAQLAKADIEALYKETRKNTVKNKYFYRSPDQIYMLKSWVTAFRYIVDAKKYNVPMRPFLGATDSAFESLASKTMQGFMSTYLSLMGTAILYYGIVCGANAYGKEIKKGTLKMVMIRPIARNKLTLSKLLAALTVATAFFAGAIAIAFVYGAIAYKSVSFTSLFVFNASKAFTASSNLTLILVVLSILIQTWVYITLAMAISTLTKNNVLGIVIPIIITTSIPMFILTQFGVGRFLLSYSAATLIDYFAIGSSMLYGGSNFWLNLAVLLSYVTIFVSSVFVIFKKRDIA